jgi:hypothetical protein
MAGFCFRFCEALNIYNARNIEHNPHVLQDYMHAFMVLDNLPFKEGATREMVSAVFIAQRCASL